MAQSPPRGRFQRDETTRKMCDEYEGEITALESENIQLRRELAAARRELSKWRESSDPDTIIRVQSLKIQDLTDECSRIRDECTLLDNKLNRVTAERASIHPNPNPNSDPSPQTPPPRRIYGRRPAPADHPALQEAVLFDTDNEGAVARTERSFSRMSRQEMEDVLKGLELEKSMLERKINRVLPKVHNIETLQKRIEREQDEQQYDNVCRLITKLRMDLGVSRHV